MKLRVVARVKPEVTETKIRRQSTSLSPLASRGGTKTHVFEAVLEDAGQAQTFSETCAPLVASLLRGVGAALFVVGGHGAGKTHTLEGTSAADGGFGTGPSRGTPARTLEGVIPRAVASILDHLKCAPSPLLSTQITLRASYISVAATAHGDAPIVDLLAPGAAPLSLREGISITYRADGAFLPAPTHVLIKDRDDVLDVLRRGRVSMAAMAAGRREYYTAPHGCLTLTLVVEDLQNIRSARGGSGRQGDEHPRREPAHLTKLHFVEVSALTAPPSAFSPARPADCAVQRDRAVTMSALASVLRALQAKPASPLHAHQRQQHVPWRESRLTRVLHEIGVGDAAEMTLCVCVEQGHAALSGTLTALAFAQRIRNYDSKRTLAAVKGRIVEKMSSGCSDDSDSDCRGGGGRAEAEVAAAALEQTRLRMQIMPVHSLEETSFGRRAVGHGDERNEDPEQLGVGGGDDGVEWMMSSPSYTPSVDSPPATRGSVEEDGEEEEEVDPVTHTLEPQPSGQTQVRLPSHSVGLHRASHAGGEGDRDSGVNSCEELRGGDLGIGKGDGAADSGATTSEAATNSLSEESVSVNGGVAGEQRAGSVADERVAAPAHEIEGAAVNEAQIANATASAVQTAIERAMEAAVLAAYAMGVEQPETTADAAGLCPAHRRASFDGAVPLEGWVGLRVRRATSDDAVAPRCSEGVLELVTAVSPAPPGGAAAIPGVLQVFAAFTELVASLRAATGDCSDRSESSSPGNAMRLEHLLDQMLMECTAAAAEIADLSRDAHRAASRADAASRDKHAALVAAATLRRECQATTSRIVAVEKNAATCKAEVAEYRRASTALAFECQRTVAAAEAAERRGRKAEARGLKARHVLEAVAGKVNAAEAAAAAAVAETAAVKVRAAHAADVVVSLRARTLKAETVASDYVRRLEVAETQHSQVAARVVALESELVRAKREVLDVAAVHVRDRVDAHEVAATPTAVRFRAETHAVRTMVASADAAVRCLEMLSVDDRLDEPQSFPGR